MLTEDEAITRWCPFVRQLVTYKSGEGHSPYNRWVDADEDQAGMPTCIASECMAFRWLPDHQIHLGNGSIAVVDIEDAEWVDSLNWWWDGRYVKSEQGRLHVLILERLAGMVPDGCVVDHIDGQPLNCLRGNLRFATPKENAANSASRGGKSRYRGVFQNRDKWSAQINKDGVRECLGSFDTEEEAAAAYDEAAKRTHGKFARLNLTPHANSGRRGYCGLAGKP